MDFVEHRRYNAKYLNVRGELQPVTLPDEEQCHFIILKSLVYPSGDVLIPLSRSFGEELGNRLSYFLTDEPHEKVPLPVHALLNQFCVLCCLYLSTALALLAGYLTAGRAYFLQNFQPFFAG